MIPTIFWMITSVENAPDGGPKSTEDQQWKACSVFLYALLPIAGLALLWGQKGLFSKLLLQLDRSCIAVCCPSLSKREKLLKWASGRLPSTWSSQARTLSSGIPELWKDGSLLCTLINSVVPGACPNPHKHWRKPPLHAQALAYKYLGLVPMFTEGELSGDLTINQERNFIHYLYKLQKAINKWPSKDELNHKVSTQYVARGMGLFTAEQNRKTVFYVYASAATKKISNILMYIRGPYGANGKATISPFHSLQAVPTIDVFKDQLEAAKTLMSFRNEDKKSFLKTISLDFTSLINGVEEKNKKNDIPIQIDVELDRAKITYIPQSSGIYEINLICNGELLGGCPYSVQVTENISGAKDSFATECQNVDEKILSTKRKIISKVIDCIDEKICIERDNVFKIRSTESSSSTQPENDFLRSRKDDILKSVTLEGVTEESNLPKNEHRKSDKNDEIKNSTEIVQHFEPDIPQILDSNRAGKLTFSDDSEPKLIKDGTEVQHGVTDVFETKTFDEVDSKTEKQTNSNEVSHTPEFQKQPTGYLKNVNSDDKQKILLSKDSNQDENNNMKSFQTKRIKSCKLHLEISPKPASNTSLDKPDHTSSICPEHIDSEVEDIDSNQLSLSEKRRTLTKQDSLIIADCDLAFSASENENFSKSKDSFSNELNDFKQSSRSSFSDSEFPLSSAVSLPCIYFTSDAATYEESTYKARRDYWERLSSRTSSGVSLANSEHSQRERVNVTRFGKRRSTERGHVTTTFTDGLSCSENDNVEGTRSFNHVIDTSLEDCALIPLQERKKLLLKNMSKQETLDSKKLKKKVTSSKKNGKTKKEKLKYFSPISDRVQTFHENSVSRESETVKKKEDKNTEAQKISTNKTLKYQFKKGILFFKNLEANFKMKQNNNEKNTNRRYSLDYQKKNNYKIKSGSLNLPNASERFSINHLYEDVFASRNGSFKGIPNKTEFINSLESFFKKEESREMQNEDEIRLNLFRNKARSKKRKSIRSLFDINY